MSTATAADDIFATQLRFSSTLPGTWGNVGTAQAGTGSPLTGMHTPGLPDGFYQVVKTAGP